jgi:solute:Na+ symporter, SSS family
MVLPSTASSVSCRLGAEVIYELGVVAWTLLLVGLFVPFAFGMYWKKANQWGGVASVLGGWGSWVLLTWVTSYNSAWAEIRPVLFAPAAT